MVKKVAIPVFVVLTLAVTFGVAHSARAYQGNFWPSFFSDLWATVIGVSLAALIGIPIGFAINHYFIGMTEQHDRQQLCKQTRELLEQLEQEVRSHFGVLQVLSTMLREPQPQQTASEAPAKPTTSIDFLLQDMFGRQFLASRAPLQIGESLITFQVGSYYARVGDLNRLLTWRIQATEQPGSWDQSIQSMLRIVGLAQSQVSFEIQKTVERLKEQVIR